MSNQTHQCLYCYQVLHETDQDYHAACSKKFFGNSTPALLPFDFSLIEELNKEIPLRTNKGAHLQARLSLAIEKKTVAQPSTRFTITGLGGNFILKCPASEYPNLPELEDLTMHLASIAQIKTAAHSLIRLESGELAYISQRIDRTKKGKLALEDMCQLTETMTEDKYQGSMEKIGKVIHAYSSNPGLDVISFFELALFCFLTGSADMHMKNFALLTSKENDISLAPANDLVASLLVLPGSNHEMALSVNGKKRYLTRYDFNSFGEKLKINSKTLENTYKRFQKNLPQMLAFIDISFLPDKMKQDYKDLIKERAQEIFDLHIEEVTKESTEELIEPQETTLEKEPEEDSITKESIESHDPVYTDLINVSTGEILEKQHEDPLSRQLNLFS